MELPGGRIVLGAVGRPDELAAAAERALAVAELARESHEWPAVSALELFVPVEGDEAPDAARACSAPVLAQRPARRAPHA